MTEVSSRSEQVVQKLMGPLRNRSIKPLPRKRANQKLMSAPPNAPVAE
jgi:hypothetical protein